MATVKSQNGFVANDRGRVKSRKIPNTSRRVTIIKGAPGFLLLHFAGWFHHTIEPVDTGIYDDWGYAERPIRGSSTTLSNHASGTAVDLNATKHPLGVRNTFSRKERRKIRRQLKKYDGCIRWGGDYKGRPDDMHFEIDRGRKACKRVRNALKAGKKPKKKRRPKSVRKALQAARKARTAAKGKPTRHGRIERAIDWLARIKKR